MTHVPAIHAFKHAPVARPAWSAISALDAPLTWIRRWQQRRQLRGVLGFPEYLLKDIGLQRHDIAREAVKPFWRP